MLEENFAQDKNLKNVVLNLDVICAHDFMFDLLFNS